MRTIYVFDQKRWAIYLADAYRATLDPNLEPICPVDISNREWDWEDRWPRVARRWEAKHVERLSAWQDDDGIYGILACDDDTFTYRPGHYFGLPRS